MRIKTQFLKLCTFILILLTFCQINVSAHASYFLGIVIDDANHRYHGEIIVEDGGHREVDIGGFVGKSGSKYFIQDNKALSDKIPKPGTEEYKSVDRSSSTTNALAYTFPSLCMDHAVDGSGADLALVQRVIEYPLSGLNDAISFILSETGSSGNGQTAILGYNLARLKSFDFNDERVKIAKESPIGINLKNTGITKDDYVKITINGKSKYFVYRCHKGYYYSSTSVAKKDPLYYLSDNESFVYSYYRTTAKEKGDLEYMDWATLVMQGNYNMDINQTTYGSMKNIAKPNELTSGIVNFFQAVLTSILSIFGLTSLEDLMLNTGIRSLNYSYGLFPHDWSSAIILIHVICQMIAWGLIGFSLTKMLWKKQLSTINIGERIALQEGLKNLIVCGFLLGTFPIIFNLLARFNAGLVDLFAASTADSSFAYLLSSSSSDFVASSFGGIIFGFISLIFQIYFNIVYFLRAITIAVLYGIAPLCIYTISLGGKTAGTFTTFMKELLGNIFVQAIHALCIAFFCNIAITGQPKILEVIIMLWAFIPITAFVKKKVFGLEDGIMGSAGALTGAASNAFDGVRQGINKATGGKGVGKGAGKEKMEYENSELGQQIDNSINKAKSTADVTLKDNNPMSIANNQDGVELNDVTAKEMQMKESRKEMFKGGLKAVGGVASIGAGIGLSGINPQAAASAMRAGGEDLGMTGLSAAKAGRNFMRSDNERDANFDIQNMIKKSGARGMKVNDKYMSWNMGGEFKKLNNGKIGFVPDKDMAESFGIDNYDNFMVDYLEEGKMNQYCPKLELMNDLYATSDPTHDNGISSQKFVDNKNERERFEMKRKEAQINLHMNKDAAGNILQTGPAVIYRQTEHMRQFNGARRANAFAGTSKLLDRTDNRNNPSRLDLEL